MNTKNKQYIYLFFARIIGFVFLLSGIGKTIDLAIFEQLIQQYSLFNNIQLIYLIAAVICFFEIIIGFELILLYKPKRNLTLSLIITILFTIAYVYGNIFHNVDDCGCFGRFNLGFHTNSLFLFIKNAILIIINVIVLKNFNVIKYDTSSVNNVIIKYFTVALAFIIGLFSSLNLHPINKKDNKINIEKLTKYLTLSQDSSYFVFLFSYSCPYCLSSVENIKKYSDLPYINKTIYLTYKSDSNNKINFIKQFDLKDPIVELPKNKFSELTTQFPVGYYIKNNKIKFAIKGVMPAKIILEKKILSN